MLDLGLFAKSRIHPVRQSEIAECGLSCIAMIANYHGFDINLGSLRRRFAPSLRGAPLSSLVSVADHLGLISKAVKLPLNKLDKLHCPCILHWDLNHYVVLEEVRRGKALIHDPAGQSRRFSLEEVSSHFTGVALELRPGTEFRSAKSRDVLKLSNLWGRLDGLKRSLFQALALTVLMQIFSLTLPYYMQTAIDRALPAQDNDLLAVLAIGFGLLVIVNAFATLMRSFVLLVSGATLGYGLASNVARRLFRLPITWFERRNIGDVLSRFQSVVPVQNMLTQGALAGFVDGFMAFLSLGLMFWYSPSLTIITLVAFVLYSFVRALSFGTERLAKNDAIIAHGKEQTTLIETLRGMVTLRLASAETMRHAVWQNRLTEATNADVGVARVGNWQAMANALIFGLENVLTIWWAIGLVIAGSGFSVGMVFAYLAYKALFVQNSVSLIDRLTEFKMLGLHLERLADIALTQEDRSFGDNAERATFFKGTVELRDVRYRYAPSEPLILDGLSMRIEAGEHVVITGPSGGGKSTLIKIVLGLVEPESGGVFIDGQLLELFGHRSFYSQIAAVLQEDNLFTGTLIDNITLFKESIDFHRVVEAATAASIHHEIMAMPMQYETFVGDMGSSLSGGQKQRILIARALYRRPRLLVLDEGTAHLDAVHEKAINAAVSSLGITRLIVAHREETVRIADRILYLSNGCIAK